MSNPAADGLKGEPSFKFRLYVAGEAPNSIQALENIRSLCREHLPDRHEIEIVDVLRHPDQAVADGILITPLLVKVAPVPQVKIFGNLSAVNSLLEALGLHGRPSHQKSSDHNGHLASEGIGGSVGD
jgi:circadian clock protein KaiB